MISRLLWSLVCGCSLAGPVVAGSLDAPAAPTAAGSAMYTLNDLYNRLNAGTPGYPRSGVFMEPAAGPGSTMRTLTEIMGKMPALDDANGAMAADVLPGKTFWGLTGGAWGPQTGAMPTRTVNAATTSQSAGYYNAFDLTTVDNDLATGNIKSGVGIFGVMGTYAGCTCTGTLYRTRWCDNGNGTVTDMLGSTVDGQLRGQCLVWLKDASWGGLKPWRADTGYDDAHARACTLSGAGLTSPGSSLTDGSSEGDWRLPTLNELKSLTTGTEPIRSGNSSPFTGVPPSNFGNYWSSTTYAPSLDYAWSVYLYDGSTYAFSKAVNEFNEFYVWPVRGGQ